MLRDFTAICRLQNFGTKMITISSAETRTTYKLQVTSYKLQVTNYKLLLKKLISRNLDKLQVTSYKLQITSVAVSVESDPL
jgi:hypothetical protein